MICTRIVTTANITQLQIIFFTCANFRFTGIFTSTRTKVLLEYLHCSGAIVIIKNQFALLCQPSKLRYLFGNNNKKSWIISLPYQWNKIKKLKSEVINRILNSLVVAAASHDRCALRAFWRNTQLWNSTVFFSSWYFELNFSQKLLYVLYFNTQ